VSNTYSLNWDLDVFFEGGSDSLALEQYINGIETNLPELHKALENMEPTSATSDASKLVKLVEDLQQLSKKMREVGAFISCLTAQNIQDKKASQLRSKMTQIRANYQTLFTKLDEHLATIDEKEWLDLLNETELKHLSFVLNERRISAKEKLSLPQEALYNDLAVDGYHAWSQMYDLIVGNIKIPFKDETGKVHELSVGQASNKFSDDDRDVRKNTFESWEEAWSNKEDYVSETLNHLAGFRLNIYKHRSWDDTLKEPLDYNRMTKDTLETMWDVIRKHKPTFTKYFERKAEMLNISQLSWYDLEAPIGKIENKMNYQDGAEFIVEQFSTLAPRMASFTKKAFTEQWIEAEDRPGKRPGGFCTTFPESKQSRIFMTYSGTASNLSTLAHELGHAFHSHVMNDIEEFNQHYAMNVAETASTFAEMIVADAAVKQAKSAEEKIVLLEDKIQRSATMFMNIHSRFLFEKRFYEERKNGPVSAQRLNELMVDAQKEAYLDSLADYHPHFWASKLHFHITGVPFYNFPYTFGYLFSLGIYAKALNDGADFEGKYIALLRDTGKMTVEELALKHLGVNLNQPEFWEEAIQPTVQDVTEFLQLTNNIK
jgi:oligoendopeptidase F